MLTTCFRGNAVSPSGGDGAAGSAGGSRRAGGTRRAGVSSRSLADAFGKVADGFLTHMRNFAPKPNAVAPLPAEATPLPAEAPPLPAGATRGVTEAAPPPSVVPQTDGMNYTPLFREWLARSRDSVSSLGSRRSLYSYESDEDHVDDSLASEESLVYARSSDSVVSNTTREAMAALSRHFASIDAEPGSPGRGRDRRACHTGEELPGQTGMQVPDAVDPEPTAPVDTSVARILPRNVRLPPLDLNRRQRFEPPFLRALTTGLDVFAPMPIVGSFAGILPAAADVVRSFIDGVEARASDDDAPASAEAEAPASAEAEAPASDDEDPASDEDEDEDKDERPLIRLNPWFDGFEEAYPRRD
jgi:hypothetical protein